MNQRELLLYWSTFAFEIVLCVYVFASRVSRLLPLFATYVFVLLTTTVGLGLTYMYFGFHSAASYDAYWIASLADVTARSLAIAELCRYGLRSYRGIWALVWRGLTVLALLFLANAALDAWGQPNRFAIYGLTLARDLDVASITILVILLLIRKYYGLTLEPLLRAIAFGMCLFCAVEVLDNTVLRNLLAGYMYTWFDTDVMSLWPALKPQIERLNDLYGTIRLCSLMISMCIWCYALRKPLISPAGAPELLPPEIYQEFSPAVNLRLRAFNDRLLEMLKP